MLSAGIRSWLRILFLLLGMSFFLGEFLTRRFATVWVKPVVYIGTIWFGTIFIALTIFFIIDILRLCFHSQSFRYYSTIVGLVALCIMSIYSVYNGTRRPVVKPVQIKIQKLSDDLNGFRIVQLSDLHLNFMKSKRWLEGVVEKTNELKPDLIVITGDLVDADLCKFREFCVVLKQLNAKYGVFAVTGNHEYYAGIDMFSEIARDSNITVLRNQKTTIADVIELVGIDDKAGKSFSETGPDLTKAMRDCDLTKLVILLSHQPDVFDKAVDLGVDLQLSGHTHAGQILPIDLIVMCYFKYPYGLYHKNSSYIYTTSGTGTWGPPMRFSSRSEIVKIILTN